MLRCWLLRQCIRTPVAPAVQCLGLAKPTPGGGLTLTTARPYLDSQYTRGIVSSAILYKKRKTKEEKNSISLNQKALKPKAKVVKVWKNMTVRDLAKGLEKDIDDVFELFLYVDNSDHYDRPRAAIDNLKVIQDTVKKAGCRFKIEAPPTTEEKVVVNKDAFRRPPASDGDMVGRPPVVTIMGHVDHGKTTLLDALRHTSVVDTEFGGITQHIGSFAVKLDSGDEVTFLDTPGHAAFRAMRARGANVTDIIVLVVAADDGVMDQTRESINHAREANVPMIVAINKIDKPEADLSQVKRNLLDCGIQLEEDGGDIQAVPVSALKGVNLDLLVETIVTQAELLHLKADPRGLVEAVVVESCTDPGRGKIATVIVQRGTLRKGCVLVAGSAWAKVRNMFDDAGRPVKAASPGQPVQIIGWRDLPSAGDVVLEVESERRASEVMEWRRNEATEVRAREEETAIQEKLNEHLKVYKAELEERRRLGLRYRSRKRGGQREKENPDIEKGPQVALVLKGDVDGSVEAIMDVLDTYHSSNCDLDVISYGVGAVTPNDVTLAASFSGSVYAFNTDVPVEVRKMALQEGVAIKESNIIYRLVEDLKEELSSKLPLKDEDEILGEANVLAEFVITEGRRRVPVAGCRCVKGSLKRDAQYRVIRGLDTVHQGTLSSMRHHKSEVDTINKDKECGLMFEDEEVRFEAGDRVVCFKVNQVEQTTDWDPGF